jgi:hypothetical protein
MFYEQPSDFDCPHCGAKYRVVGVVAPSQFEERVVLCRHCQRPLQSRHEQFLLKYFLVERPGERQRLVR